MCSALRPAGSSDYDFRIVDRAQNVGLRITADRPVAQLVLCPFAQTFRCT
jgi:hypothetical protein